MESHTEYVEKILAVISKHDVAPLVSGAATGILGAL
tara:strand:- start:877 stop:984 length:108 start_codon:yes stop_codon:yes gene_type:complete